MGRSYHSKLGFRVKVQKSIPEITCGKEAGTCEERSWDYDLTFILTQNIEKV